MQEKWQIQSKFNIYQVFIYNLHIYNPSQISRLMFIHTSLVVKMWSNFKKILFHTNACRRPYEINWNIYFIKHVLIIWYVNFLLTYLFIYLLDMNIENMASNAQTLWEKKMFCNLPCNSLYYMLLMLSDKLQELQKLQLTIYIVQLITIQLQLCYNNSFSTIMQLPYDYNHNIMFTSFFIHPSKFNMWHYEDFSWFFRNINIHRSLRLFILDGLGLWHMAKSKVATWLINWILETNIYIYT